MYLYVKLGVYYLFLKIILLISVVASLVVYSYNINE